jgi:predicted Zn-dependent protease
MNKYLILIFLLVSGVLSAELNQKAILLKQVNRYENSRQYDRANKLLIQLMTSESNDSEVISRLINNYLLMKKTEDAEHVLNAKKDVLSDIEFIKLSISVLLRKGEAEQAYSLSEDFIGENNGKIHYAKILASAFEQYGHFEQSVILYEKAVTSSKDKYLFSVELARNYQRVNKFDEAIRKYFVHLEKNPAYKNSHFNQIKIMLKEDETLIQTVKKYTEKSTNKDFKEIYALSLAEIGDLDSALEIYKTLDLNKLFTFALNQHSYGKNEIASRAFLEFAQLTKEPNRKADAEFESAKIKFKMNELEECKILLNNIYNNKGIQDKKYKYKSRTNRYCRELLGKIALMQNEPEDVVLGYYREAKTFALNSKEQKEIDFEIINYMIMSERFDESRQMLARILKDEDTSSSVYHLGYYYSFLSATMQNDAAADSLLGELMISLPGSPLTNDALFLNFLASEQEDEIKESFLQAFRKKKLFKNAEAVTLLEGKESESLKILAGEWALEINDLAKAKEIFSAEFTMEPFADYSALKLTQINDSYNEAAEFLSENPGSVFSPEFRKLMQQTKENKDE